MSYELVHKPAFTSQLVALPSAVLPQILKKIELLREDPTPDAKVKKKLHSAAGNVYRLRSGDYRILYSYAPGWVTLLGVDNRKVVYEGELPEGEEPAGDIEVLRDLGAILDPKPGTSPTGPAPAESELLPHPITEELLRRLRIPGEFDSRLVGIETVGVLETVAIPEDLRIRLYEAVTSTDLQVVLDQPDYLTGDITDLLRFVEGDLLGFLMKLDPDQQKLVEWGIEGSGPVLLKGGPGTGKSMIALYRARAIIDFLKAGGTAEPRVLFTTYTSALIAASEQLLGKLLAGDAGLVSVRTADGVATEVVRNADGAFKVASANEVPAAIAQAVASAQFTGNELAQEAQRRAVARLSAEYLSSEFAAVIESREISDLDGYLGAQRSGRIVPLNRVQREAVWAVYERFQEILRDAGRRSWQQIRRRAAELAREGRAGERYDAVIVDEAQDLDPTSIRMLACLVAEPSRLFVTADANQSIYGSGFRWTDVHEDLSFAGHTRMLRINYRSTREIGRAAHSYLGADTLEAVEEPEYVKEGPLPAVRRVADAFAEGQLLTRFLPGAAREFKLGIGGCAVLVPTKTAGQSIAGQLSYEGVKAEFMEGRDIDLAAPVVKVITLSSAKGLEFPVVAIAGFIHSPNPGFHKQWQEEERREWLMTLRRTVFVGMTRAMRALLVIVPASSESLVFDGFDGTLWNMGA